MNQDRKKHWEGVYTKKTPTLDIPSISLHYAKERLGKLAAQVSWIEADVTQFAPPQKYDLWHDRE